MSEKLPYMTHYAALTKALTKIKEAATPERFTQDFLATKLGMKGGNEKSVIPFFKRTGFLASDGAPTELYRRYRNPAESANAAAQALRIGFKPVFEVNENAHKLADKDLKGIVVQVTGFEADSNPVRFIVGSFKAFKAFASGAEPPTEVVEPETTAERSESTLGEHIRPAKLGLSYTINLNLPATSDIAVFNAIFKALREHLLR